MEQLQEYDNLIRAMGALFYTSKRMGDLVPCIFQAWKDISFENRAKNIRNMLSDSENNLNHYINKNRGKQHQEDSMNVDMQGLGSDGRTINYDNITEDKIEVDEYDEDEFDFQANEEEEFLRVEDSNQSCSIIPINNVKANGADSQYDDDEDEFSMEEEEDDEALAAAQEEEKRKNKEEWNFKEDDPEVQNAKLLEKYA